MSVYVGTAVHTHLVNCSIHEGVEVYQGSIELQMIFPVQIPVLDLISEQVSIVTELTSSPNATHTKPAVKRLECKDTITTSSGEVAPEFARLFSNIESKDGSSITTT